MSMFENSIDQYYIKLPQFEGPFDLILFFIERDEIEIQNIPISKITSDFLDYIHHMDQFNIELASEFIVVAATLMRIKTKMLLPRKELDESGNEIDPREELVQRLLEYKKFKSIIEEMKSLEEVRRSLHSRGNIKSELSTYSGAALLESEWESLDLYKLFSVFQKVMERFNQEKTKVAHTVVSFAYTIEDQRNHLLSAIKGKVSQSFESLFDRMDNRLHAIVTFLALLELINSRRLEIKISGDINSFYISQGENYSESLNGEITEDE
ncbi:segregation and condensation protein A [Membranihabitans marinus]|uniref:segregation and condensation protein A n=1 Tax=Membranihabitans marinus TaxID=1227546 RepID=UPI001F37CCDE|nr:segregation/condensation protein A [Membranihabitans marinus]